MRVNSKLVVVISITCTLFTLAYPALAVISGSKHDFSAATWSGGEICNVCHTPHEGEALEAPLWNHATSTATYTLYSSPSLLVTPEQPDPGSVSRMCLSCHDGTVAIDSFGNNTGTQFMDTVNPGALLGTDLSNDHPIGIMWDHQSPPLICGNCHTIPQRVRFFRRNGRSYVECASCHDVHNNVTNPQMLRVSMDGSQLCLICHNK